MKINGGVYKYLFLATEDKEVIQRFKTEFNETILLPDRNLPDYHGEIITSLFNNEGITKRTATEEYLEDMYFLSKCDSLIANVSSGIITVLLMNNGRYEFTRIVDYGEYSVTTVR